MVAHATTDLLGATPVIHAALAAGLAQGQESGFVAEMRALAEQESGLALRLAMVLACIKRLDVSELGYSGFLAFCRERVDWRQAWMRALVRLVESPLDQVKAAAAAGSLPLRVAVQAPGRIPVEEQTAWLGGAVLERSAPARPRCTFHGRDAEVVERARELARVCMARRAPLAEVDEYILRHWREHVPGKALDEGRTPPPPPEPGTLDFEWAAPSGGQDPAPEASGSPVEVAPAQALFGPWRPPTNLPDALAQLEAVQDVLRGREALLARAFALAHHHALWIRAGFDSAWEFADQVLGWSRRTAQRRRKLGWALDWFPQLDEAVREGFSLVGAREIGWLADDDAQCDRWLDLARHLGQQEIIRAMAKWGNRLGDYERALAIARRHAAELLGPGGPTTRPSGTVEVFVIGGDGGDGRGAPSAGSPDIDAADREPASRAGNADSDAASATAQPAPPGGTPEVALRVALPAPEPERAGTLRAHPQLAEAARWFLAHNQPRTPSGFTASKRRARFRCENPECGRATFRVEAHHIHWRRHGGADDLTNAVVLCPSCHLRGVHTRDERIRVSRVVVEGLEALLWEYPGRAPVLQFREVPPRRPVRATRRSDA